MKIKIALILLTLSCLFVTGAVAERGRWITPEVIAEVTGTDMSDPVKYEVTFTVRYNSVSPEEASRIAEQIMLNHSSGCKVEVRIEKVGDLSTNIYYDTTGGNVLTLESNNVWVSE